MTLNFREFCDKIPVRENIIVNMLFLYISTVITYLPGSSQKIKRENPILELFPKI